MSVLLLEKCSIEISGQFKCVWCLWVSVKEKGEIIQREGNHVNHTSTLYMNYLYEISWWVFHFIGHVTMSNDFQEMLLLKMQ